MIRWVIVSCIFCCLQAEELQWQEIIYQGYDRARLPLVIGYINGASSVTLPWGFAGLGWGLICEKGHHGVNVYESCVRGTQGDTIYDALSLLSANYLYYEDASAMNTLYWGAGTGYTVLINSERSYMARVVKIVPVIGYVYHRYAPIRVMMQCDLTMMRVCGTPEWLSKKYIVQPSFICSIGFTLW